MYTYIYIYKESYSKNYKIYKLFVENVSMKLFLKA